LICDLVFLLCYPNEPELIATQMAATPAPGARTIPVSLHFSQTNEIRKHAAGNTSREQLLRIPLKKSSPHRESG